MVEYVLKTANDIILIQFKLVLIRSNKERNRISKFPSCTKLCTYVTDCNGKLGKLPTLFIYIHLSYTKIHTNTCINTVDWHIHTVVLISLCSRLIIFLWTAALVLKYLSMRLCNFLQCEIKTFWVIVKF